MAYGFVRWHHLEWLTEFIRRPELGYAQGQSVACREVEPVFPCVEEVESADALQRYVGEMVRHVDLVRLRADVTAYFQGKRVFRDETFEVVDVGHPGLTSY